MGSAKSSLYAYCIVRLDQDEPWDVFPGIADRSVFAVRDQKVAMLISRLDRLRLDEHKHVLQHGQVLHRVFEKRTVLPFRFGTTFPSEVEIRAILTQNREQFVEGLRQMRGKAEVHLKLSFRVHQPAPPRSMAATAGTNGSAVGRLTVSSQGYSIAPPRSHSETAKVQADHVIECIKTVFQPIQEQVSVRYLERGQVQLEVRCLVPEANVDFCRKFALTGFEHLDDVQLQVTGPWPPCHFLPVSAKLPNRTERMMPAPGRLPLRSRGARV
jgi:hypothetical protein